MTGCIEHQGAPAFGCRACNATFAGRQVDGGAAAVLMDRSYEKGFRDGAKWVIAGARVRIAETLRDLEKTTKRVERMATEPNTEGEGK
jgi:hypothetical protein